MRILKNPNVDFLSKRLVAAGISAVVIGIGVVSLVTSGGPRLGIDFAGGSQVIVRFAEAPDVNVVRDTLERGGLANATIQEFRSSTFDDIADELIIQSPGLDAGSNIDTVVATVNSALSGLLGGAQDGMDLNTASRGDLVASLILANPLGFNLTADPETAESLYQAEVTKLLDAKATAGLFTDWSEVEAAGIDAAVLGVFRGEGYFGPYAIVGSDFVGAQVGRALRSQTIQAIVWALVGMLAYITYRFQFKYGVGAVAALAHDVLVVLGAFSLTGREFNLPVVAAFLTIVGYSLNDTVVVFDRVRENNTTLRRMPLRERFNTSLNQTLSRTLLTSVTTLIVVTGLFIFGGPVINDFAFALLIGVLVGTYSSLFVASPIVYLWLKRDLAKRH
ncbi:MAG: protein translocase subunit SecF [Acidobacteria bacterium]|nr:protein translocase subunit SecF [Acidobacteriota bacterium]